MAMEHTSLSSLAAVADATMAPTSPHGSDEADWDFVDESAAKEIEIQRQSDDLRVQEMGATQQLMPLDHAHPGVIDDASLQQMADLAACVERLQIAREAVDQLSPVSSTTGSVLTRLGLEHSQKAVDELAGASQPLATEAALTAASSAEGEVDVPMDGTKDQPSPRTKVPPLPGFLAAKAQKIHSDAIRFKIDKADPNRVKFAMFPDSFPSVPGTFPALLQGTSECDWGLHPMKLQARQQEIWKTQFQPTYKKSGLGYSNLKERPTGDQPYERMCAKCFTGVPDEATKCWTCRHEKLVPYSAPLAQARRHGTSSLSMARPPRSRT